MEVFIGNLSAKTKLLEIHNILGEYQMHSDFTTYEGKDCDHSQYHFVVVKIDDESKASELILRLNGMDLTGRHLEVREYICRNQLSQKSWNGDDRRINDQMDLALN